MVILFRKHLHHLFQQQISIWPSHILFGKSLAAIRDVIRALNPDGNCYETMLHFFRSKADQLSEIRKRWCEVILGYRFFCIPLKINIQNGLQSAAAWEGSTIDLSMQGKANRLLISYKYYSTTFYGRFPRY